MSFNRRWLFIIVPLVIVLVAGAGFVIWAGTPSGETMPEALDALESDDVVAVDTSRWLVFTPADSEPTTGFIFYPGGRVLAQSYAPLGRRLAEEGYLAVLVTVPLNLAIFDTGAAAPVIEAFPDIRHWAVGGHSLGGVAAADFAHSNPGTVEGLLIYASFPQAADDLSDRDDLVVASVYGTLDGLALAEEIENSAQYLPDDTQFVAIEGGNHAQFGWYGEQSGDNAATISHEEQTDQIVAATVAVLEAISAE